MLLYRVSFIDRECKRLNATNVCRTWIDGKSELYRGLVVSLPVKALVKARKGFFHARQRLEKWRRRGSKEIGKRRETFGKETRWGWFVRQKWKKVAVTARSRGWLYRINRGELTISIAFERGKESFNVEILQAFLSTAAVTRLRV